MINFAYKIDKKFLVDGLLPNLETLVRIINNNFKAQEKDIEIKKGLLDQFIPLIEYIGEKCGQPGYEATVQVVFPLLDKLLYAPNE